VYTLVGDVGGTHLRLGLACYNKDKIQLSHLVRFRTADFNCLETALNHYFSTLKPHTYTQAVFAVAGPVVDQLCQMTNSQWQLDSTQIKKTFSFSICHLMNDVEAIAWSLTELTSADKVTINPGADNCHGNRCVLASGTGLGEAGVIWHQNAVVPFACEGGHSDFSATSEVEWQLLCYLQSVVGHVSWERVLCGSGLESIYQFLLERSTDKSAGLHTNHAHFSAAAITQAALQNESSTSVGALELFTDLLATEAANFALKTMAHGGIYLAGGIPPKILPFLQRERFMRRYRDKGRMSALVASMPIYVVQTDYAALLGAACYARDL
jgi:glucokinase